MKRIQRKRTKGWKMPPTAKYVGRPTQWGNPFVVSQNKTGAWLITDDRTGEHVGRLGHDGIYKTKRLALEDAVDFFRVDIEDTVEPDLSLFLAPLLEYEEVACWCPLDSPCHADVLIEFLSDLKEWVDCLT